METFDQILQAAEDLGSVKRSHIQSMINYAIDQGLEVSSIQDQLNTLSFMTPADLTKIMEDIASYEL